MNFVNIIIISTILVIVAIVIVVITKSLKNVDEKIVEELKSDGKGNGGQLNIFSKIKNGGIVFFEVVIKKIKKSIQKLHSWIIKEKRKNKNEIIKARDELVIDKEDEKNDASSEKLQNDDKIEDGSVERIEKKSLNIDATNTKESDKKKDNKEEDISTFYTKEEEIAVDSLSIEKKGRNNSDKKGFMKSLFKKKKNNKKIVDIHDGSAEKWSLNNNVVVNRNNNDNNGGNKQIQDDIKVKEVGRKFTQNTKRSIEDNEEMDMNDDEVIGVDRKILEKKLLQKIDNNPKELRNYRELGDLYIKMEKLEDALEVFNYILSITPRDLVALRKKRKIKLLKRIAK